MILPLALALHLAALPPLAAEPGTPPAVADLLAQRDRSWDADLPRILRGETGGQGDVPNWRYDPRHTASGYIQITDTNWRRFAPKLGIDVQRYPTAMAAPESWQLAVGKLMHRMYGIAPWDAAHGGSQPTRGLRAALHVLTAGRALPPVSVTRIPPPSRLAAAAPELPAWRGYGGSPGTASSWRAFSESGGDH
jgi:hypothetical protein